MLEENYRDMFVQLLLQEIKDYRKGLTTNNFHLYNDCKKWVRHKGILFQSAAAIMKMTPEELEEKLLRLYSEMEDDLESGKFSKVKKQIRKREREAYLLKLEKKIVWKKRPEDEYEIVFAF